MLHRPLRRLVVVVATIVAALIAIVVPAGYVWEGVCAEQEMLAFKARFTAERVERYIYVHQDMWQYHHVRIAQEIALTGITSAYQKVVDQAGMVVVEQGPEQRAPTVSISIPFRLNDTDAGTVTLTASVHDIVINGLFVTALCWILAAIAYFAVRYLPLRALDRVVADLAREQERFRLALDNMGQGLCLLDARQRVVVVSQRMIGMFGLAHRGNLVGMHAAGLLGLISERLAPGQRPPSGALTDTTTPSDVPSVMHLNDGRAITMTRRATDNGLLVVTFDDITDQLRAQQADTDRAAAQAEARLMREREQLAQETSKAKSMFLATMSHEIRTPMNAVLGLATSLLDTPLSPEQHRAVSTIHESGDSLLRILNDILDYSKLEAGKLVFEAVTFAPVTLAEAARSILGPRAQVRGVGFEVIMGPDLPEALTGDAARLRQVLLNLVSNAVKFTEKGGISIETSCLSRQDGKARMQWRVRDTGIGIAADRLHELFAEFVQADGSINRRFGGSGLGLAICKRIIEQMDGRIWIESQLGQGSVFSFEVTLPVADPVRVVDQTRVVDPVGELKARIARQGRPPRILVAEDNATNQFVIRQMLKGFDLRLDMAANGAEAVAMTEQHSHDLIFMDMQMPEVDGLAATRLIRAKGGRFAQMPIVALTGNAFDDDQRACLDAGMDAFIAKPINKTLLLATLLRLCPWDDVPADQRAEEPVVG